MANKKRRGPSEPVRVKTTAEQPVDSATAAKRSRRGGRETVDALVVAFVLAFLIRTFQAEAFVIPTGSMAPTLMGRHKDVFCDQCGTRFKVNSSDDATDLGPILQRQVAEGRITPATARKRLAGTLCVGGECPQCRHLMLLENLETESIRPEWQQEAEQTANYSGDRLVVSKYAYSFSDPKRWDVAVFKYPGNSQTNYIKRVTGLPKEELRIFQGDLFVRPIDSDEDFHIARKPAKTVLAMQQFVHDTHHEASSLIDAGWPLSWSGAEGWEVEPGPVVTDHGTSVYQPRYRGAAAEGETRWLRYHHTPPNENVWRRILGDKEKPGVDPEPQLITDFTPYNTRLNLDQAAENRQLSLAPRRRRPEDFGRLGLHWVSDLIVEAQIKSDSGEGQVSLDLVEGGDHFGVTVNLPTGDATLWRRPFEGTEREEIAKASTSLRGAGAHRLRLANVDNRLLLWVDGSLVDVDGAYVDEAHDAVGPAAAPRSSDTDEGDLAPAGVGVSGGELVVERLKLWRDGYYIAMRLDRGMRGQHTGLTTDLPPAAFEAEDQRDWLGSLRKLPEDPDLWYAFANRQSVDFRIEEGQLFVMGDNSGWSLDARLWAVGNGREGGHPGGPYLERTQLVGKAICVYWPHSWYSVPGTGRRIPAWPNFEDMRLVR